MNPERLVGGELADAGADDLHQARAGAGGQVPGVARRLVRELPDATLHVSDSSGHDVGLDRSGEIMSVLASPVK